VTEAGDYPFFAGWRSDPFFFDRRGVLNNLQFTGDDYFADQDVCSIVLEVPNAAPGTKEVGLWHRTLVPAHGAGGGWVTAEPAAQSDRTPARIRALAPLLGADSSAILAELGYGADDNARLEREQIVRKPSVS
jgi:hypothetical protein